MGYNKKAFYEFSRVPKYGGGIGKTLKKAWKGFKKGFKSASPYLMEILRLGEEVSRPLLDSTLDHAVQNKDLNKIVRGAKDLGVKSALKSSINAPKVGDLADQAKDSFKDYLTDQGEKLLGITEPKQGGAMKGKKGMKFMGAYGDDFTGKAWNQRKGAGIRVDKLPAKFKGMFLG